MFFSETNETEYFTLWREHFFCFFQTLHVRVAFGGIEHTPHYAVNPDVPTDTRQWVSDVQIRHAGQMVRLAAQLRVFSTLRNSPTECIAHVLWISFEL